MALNWFLAKLIIEKCFIVLPELSFMQVGIFEIYVDILPYTLCAIPSWITFSNNQFSHIITQKQSIIIEWNVLYRFQLNFFINIEIYYH